jgi:hypothetical protein
VSAKLVARHSENWIILFTQQYPPLNALQAPLLPTGCRRRILSCPADRVAPPSQDKWGSLELSSAVSNLTIFAGQYAPQHNNYLAD